MFSISLRYFFAGKHNEDGLFCCEVDAYVIAVDARGCLVVGRQVARLNV